MDYSMNRNRLQPLKKGQKHKENKFVLDCTNTERSHLQPYNSFKDKYLKYYVIRMSKKKSRNKLAPLTNKTPVDKTRFDDFLQKKKESLLRGLQAEESGNSSNRKDEIDNDGENQIEEKGYSNNYPHHSSQKSLEIT